jgi:hypothetical protein
MSMGMMGSAGATAPAPEAELLLTLHELVALLRDPEAPVSSPTAKLIHEIWSALCDPPIADRLLELRDALGELALKEAAVAAREARVAKIEAAVAALAEVTA